MDNQTSKIAELSDLLLRSLGCGSTRLVGLVNNISNSDLYIDFVPTKGKLWYCKS